MRIRNLQLISNIDIFILKKFTYKFIYNNNITMYLPKIFNLEGTDCTCIHSSIAPIIYNTSLRSRHDIAKANFDQLHLLSKS